MNYVQIKLSQFTIIKYLHKINVQAFIHSEVDCLPITRYISYDKYLWHQACVSYLYRIVYDQMIFRIVLSSVSLV